MQGNNGLLAKTVEKAYFSWFFSLHLIFKITRTATFAKRQFCSASFQVFERTVLELRFNLIRKHLIKNSHTLRSKNYSNAILLLFAQTMTSLKSIKLVPRVLSLASRKNPDCSWARGNQCVSINCAAGVAPPLNFVDWTMKYYLG